MPSVVVFANYSKLDFLADWQRLRAFLQKTLLHTAKMEHHSQQDPLSTGARRAQEGEVDETLWYARSCTCGTIIDVLSALDVAPAKGGVGPQAAVEISEEAGMQIRVLEGAHSPSTLPSWHLARHSATPPQATQATRALGSARGAPHRGVRTRSQALTLRTPWGQGPSLASSLASALHGVTPLATLHVEHSTLQAPRCTALPRSSRPFSKNGPAPLPSRQASLTPPSPTLPSLTPHLLARSRSGRPSPDRPPPIASQSRPYRNKCPVALLLINVTTTCHMHMCMHMCMCM